MAKLLTVLAQEQKTFSHFRHLEKISIFFRKFSIFFSILYNYTGPVEIKNREITLTALLGQKIWTAYTTALKSFRSILKWFPILILFKTYYCN
jgi:hypothetical protein